MVFSSLYASWKSGTPRRRRPQSRPACSRGVQPRLEGLEVRCVPSTLSVTSSADNGSVGTLRWAVGVADTSTTPDTITIQTTQPIVLTQGQLLLSAGMTIEATAGMATISGNGVSRVFEVEVAPLASVTLNALKITGGNASGGFGGAIWDTRGKLTVTHCTLSGNAAEYGGAIGNTGTVSVSGCTLSGNSAELGGAIYNRGTLMVANCALSDNSASMQGGAIASLSSVYPTIESSIFSGNTPTSLFGTGFYGAYNTGLPSGAVLPPPHGSYGG